jgi:hypothetical protein
VIDFNNYGTTFQQAEGTETPRGKFGRSLPKPFPYLPSSREFQVYEDTTDSANPAQHVSVNMKDWQDFSGQDKHSIFADPKWVNPEAGRFDVAADSPNLLPDGQIIGATGCVGENPNMQPEAVILAPCSGEEMKGAFTVTALASDFDGTVRKVEFLAGGKLIGEASGAPPHEAKAVKLEPGAYSITVRATDDKGAVAVSDAVNICVK